MPKFDYEYLKQFENNYKLVPIIDEYFSDNITPVQILKRLKELDSKVFLLESANNSGVRGRYSFLGYDPEVELIVKNNQIIIKDKDSEIKIDSNNPTKIINDYLENYRSPKLEGYPNLTGGLIGYVAYDYYKYTEPILSFENPDSYDFNDLHLMLFKDLIIFDHFRDKILIVSNASTKNLEKNIGLAKQKIINIKSLLEELPKEDYSLKIICDFKPTFTEDEYSEVIKKAKEYIVEGDIFQVVPSNRIEGEIEGSLFPAYRVMRSENPSPYMYYIQIDDNEIIGTSPETLVKQEGDKLTTFPIAGSRPRGKTSKEDQELEDDLLSDKKELAEHNMLVDLGRNDLGRVSKMNSVFVEDYLQIQKYSKIMHLTSKVSSIKKDNVSALESLGNILPAGTLSGAPKIRACQIIEELETSKRGPYGGAIGYISFNGDMDMCIAIRSAFKTNNKVFAQSGGGIVYDSQEHSEYLETVNKAAAVIEAIKIGEKNIHDFSFR